MADTSNLLSVNQNNGSVPFFPSYTWNYLNADIFTSATQKNQFLLTFSWIQAFFDPTAITVIPQLAIWSGHYLPDGITPLLNGVRFGYSGERINIKGNALFATGTNVRGQTVISTPINAASPSDSLSQVIAYGGMY
jgi:hypothetical protein